MMLRAILFDIDDTLFSTSELTHEARLASITAMIGAGLRAGSEECYRELREIVAEFGSNYPHHFEMLLRRLGHQAYAGRNEAVVVAAGVAAYHDTKMSRLRPFPDVAEVLPRLHASGRRLGIITAGLKHKQAEKLVRLHVLPYFDPEAIFITDQMGISKPNPKLYHKVHTALGLAGGECMYVGNSPVNDIDPAKDEGMTTVLVRRGGKELAAHGRTIPDHTIADFWELVDILRRDYEIIIG
ncbi:MAG: TIGR02253 family HAD-type hydrolase [Candidatus Schekmanbacteria bacterium]|nr:TIGR02253 family HAD-type hydrolase [Candidatus Schekmanbacteria bacterium]